MISTTIHKSVIRHPHVMGGDRDIIYVSILISIASAMILMNIESIIFGLILFFVAVPAAKKMYKTDPILKDLYIRYIKYKHYYPCRATPFFDDMGTIIKW